MILYRTTHAAAPFIWESADQPPARWHDAGDGPVHYFSTTADGAWAEVIRHEEIDRAEDLMGLRSRAMWVVELSDHEQLAESRLSFEVLTGGPGTYARCRSEAKRLRSTGARGLRTPSAALKPRGAVLYRVEAGQRLEPVESEVVVLFGRRPDLEAHLAGVGGTPRPGLLPNVRPLTR